MGLVKRKCSECGFEDEIWDYVRFCPECDYELEGWIPDWQRELGAKEKAERKERRVFIGDGYAE